MQAATARMMAPARSTPGYPAMMPMVPTTIAPPRITRSFHIIGHCYFPVWLGVMKGQRPRRSGPPPRVQDAGDDAPGMLAGGRQVWETQGLDAPRPDMDVQMLHILDHHLR